MNKYKLILIMAALFLSLPLQTGAFSEKELVAIGQALEAESGGQEDALAKEPNISDRQPAEQSIEAQSDDDLSPIEIFYRIGQVREKASPVSDPDRAERELRQRDQQIEELFGKGEKNE
jgi:hypothetical protein